MGVTRDGWLDWAERLPGPADKVYSQPNAAAGYIPHSMVGWRQGWYARLFSTTRGADGRYTSYAAASVHGSILQDGRVIQHYPFTASCWAAGSYEANTRFVSFENEGGYDPPSEPLTAAQVDANVRIIRDLAAWRGWTPRRPTSLHDKTATLYEHRECTRFGSAPTACPSGRIPWDVILARLSAKSEEDEMTDTELIEIIRSLQDGEFVQDGYIIWQVFKPPRADYPILRRVDDSNADIVRNPRHVPLAVTAYLPRGPDL